MADGRFLDALVVTGNFLRAGMQDMNTQYYLLAREDLGADGPRAKQRFPCTDDGYIRTVT
jgi:hypothetical protein